MALGGTLSRYCVRAILYTLYAPTVRPSSPAAPASVGTLLLPRTGPRPYKSLLDCVDVYPALLDRIFHCVSTIELDYTTASSQSLPMKAGSLLSTMDMTSSTAT